MPKAIKHQNASFEEFKQTSLEKNSNKLIWIFMAVLAVLLLISAVVRLFVVVEEPPVQQNTWQGLTPGFAITQNLAEQLGTPVSVENLPAEKKQVSYKAQDFKAYYNEVVVDKDGTVEFIKTPIAYSDENTLTQYTTLYGEPDFSLYASHISDSLRAHVFLDEGLTVIANETTLVIEELWYFQPTDKETFMLQWGSQLSEYPSGPEAFPI